jgi:hypothetical protein
MTTQHGHGRARRRWPAWRPPWRTGSQDLNQHSENDRRQSANHRTGRLITHGVPDPPSDAARAHLPVAPSQRSRSRPCATRCKRSTHCRTLIEPSPAASGPCMPSSGVGWQPSRFLADRGEAERAFPLAERLGSINAAVLGTTLVSGCNRVAVHARRYRRGQGPDGGGLFGPPFGCSGVGGSGHGLRARVTPRGDEALLLSR